MGRTSGPQKPTIDLVANLSNVSKTTVSRFLNGKFEFMSEETRTRIQQVIEELDYRPSNFARSLKSKRSGLIGVVIADIGTPFSSILVKGIEDLCSARGYHVLIANSNEDPVKERACLESLIGDEMVEGLIVNTTGQNDELLARLGRVRPIVMAERAMATLTYDTVATESYSISSQAITHMQQNGFDTIAFFTQPIGFNTARRARLRAYQDTYHGPTYIYQLTINHQQDVRTAVSEFLTAVPDRHPAIFAVNGVTTLAVLRAVANLGLRIPDDLGLCGFDDWEWAALIPPGITTIDHPTYDIGVESAKRVIARIAGAKGDPKWIQLQSTLHVRGSTTLRTERVRFT